MRVSRGDLSRSFTWINAGAQNRTHNQFFVNFKVFEATYTSQTRVFFSINVFTVIQRIGFILKKFLSSQSMAWESVSVFLKKGSLKCKISIHKRHSRPTSHRHRLFHRLSVTWSTCCFSIFILFRSKQLDTRTSFLLHKLFSFLFVSWWCSSFEIK